LTLLGSGSWMGGGPLGTESVAALLLEEVSAGGAGVELVVEPGGGCVLGVCSV